MSVVRGLAAALLLATALHGQPQYATIEVPLPTTVDCASPTADEQCSEACRAHKPGQAICGACEPAGNSEQLQCRCHTESSHASATCDPMYMTYDQFWFETMDQCTHILATNKKLSTTVPQFTVYGSNKCMPDSAEPMTGECWGTYTNYVELSVHGQRIRVDIQPGWGLQRTVSVNGKHTIGNYFWARRDEKIEVTRSAGVAWNEDCPDCLEVRIWTDFGLEITVTSAFAAVYLTLPKTDDFINKVHGAFGHFNADGDMDNDVVTPTSVVITQNEMYENWEQAGTNFTRSWSTKQQDDKSCDKPFARRKCLPPVKRFADEHCDMEALFPECFNGPYEYAYLEQYRARWSLTPNGRRRIAYFESEQFQTNTERHMAWAAEMYGQRCAADVCALSRPNQPVDNGACDAVTQFALQCRHFKPDADLTFRTPEFCPLKCGANAAYRRCASGQPTCDDLKKGRKSDRDGVCIDGCVCVRGHVLDETTGNCVKKNRCHK